MTGSLSTKPPYRIPLLSEVRAVPWNGLTVASTFSGCGGSCLGFEMAGYRVKWASEFIPAAVETYRANHRDVPVSTRDIREVTGTEILAEAGVEAGTIDVLEGSPPCASFSTAGKRAAGWGDQRKYSDTTQRVDDLFFEYARVLGDLQPRAFVAENVAGLTIGVAKGYFKMIHAALAACGYRVEARMLDAQWLGVPQSRRRVIFVGFRNDLGLDPVFPDPLPYRYSIRDALPWIGGVTSKAHGYYEGGYRSSDRPAPTIVQTSGGAAYHDHRVYIEHDSMGQEGKKRIDVDGPMVALRTPQGGANTRYHVVEPVLGEAIGVEWDKLKPGESSDRYFNLVRPDPEKPVPTVTQAGGNLGLASVTHPTEKRKFTIAELRRLCGFPDDFVLTGTYAQQWERLGRAVPPPMMRAVAEKLSEVLLSAG